jgi:hypothetical protein
MTDKLEPYERCLVRSWSIDHSISINRYGSVDKVLKDAEKIRQYIEHQGNAKVVILKRKADKAE